MVLESNLTMANLVHRDYSKEFVQVGDTVTIRKPAKFVAKNFTGEVDEQDITEGSVAVKMDRFRDVTVKVTSKQLTLDIKDFSEQVIKPAMMALVQAVDCDLLAVGVEKAGRTATVSQNPVISDIAGVGKALDIAKAPRDNRRLTTLYSPTKVRVGYYGASGNTLVSDNLSLGMGSSKTTHHSCTIPNAENMRRVSASQGGQVLCPTWRFENPNSTVDVTNYLTNIVITIDYTLPIGKTNHIFIDTNQPSEIYIGTQPVKEVYVGTTKVFG